LLAFFRKNYNKFKKKREQGTGNRERETGVW